MQSYERMTEYKIPKAFSANLFNKLFKIKATDKPEDLSSRKKNLIVEFNNIYESELASHGETLWGLFNAVTFYENHVGIKEEKKLDHIYIGGGKRNMLLTYNDIMAFIESKESKRSLVGI
jgi:hypothetical protein